MKCRHLWMQEKKQREVIFWDYPLKKRFLFRRGTFYVYQNLYDGEFKIYDIIRYYYCSKCLKRKSVIEEVRPLIPSPGRAIYDWVNNEFILPEGVKI